MKRELSFLLAAAMAASLAGCAADIADADSKMRMYFQPTIRRSGLCDSEKESLRQSITECRRLSFIFLIDI